ncbi:Mannose-P-dolichol utilization defect 1 [Chionoecetes opilio]|uniref:Mannose-P-dolichol utilization defect 1 protein homolog n=1 Tax=Chionoecetes opilio TaxID=41210 RepID=A0A8J4YMS1_CHIOP|nr:Mannose-P-dolichol utilization defect 1 [Chionoecetes opilio]
MAALFRRLCLLVLTEACYDEFFVKFNFLHVPCLRAAVSKGLGLGVVGGSILVKVPQIMKIVRAKSGEGISIAGTTLEVTAITFNVGYSFVNRYPFSSYGDGVFLLVQTTITAMLVLLYGGAPKKAALYVLSVFTVAAVLCSGQVPIKFMWMLQALNIPVVFAGKMVQAVTNFKNSSTGQLSAVTMTMLFLGSTARIFTSIQETGDPIIILSYSVATFANGLIMTQVLYYWNAPAKSKKE